MENYIINSYKEGSSICEISRTIKKSRTFVSNVLLRNKIERRSLSESRKLFLKNHPESHSWRRIGKLKSKPCESFKQILKNEGIDFIEEFSDFDRFYSIDIAFPKMKIGFEINGNQHYDENWQLKEYYKNRSSYLEGIGWKIYQIHYSICFDKNKVLDIYQKLKSNEKYQFDFDMYLNNKKERKENSKKRKFKNCECGELIYKSSDRCKKCSRKFVGIINRKIKNRPSIDELMNDIKNIGYMATGRKYGVSDNSIRKWIK